MVDDCQLERFETVINIADEDCLIRLPNLNCEITKSKIKESALIFVIQKFFSLLWLPVTRLDNYLSHKRSYNGFIWFIFD